MAKRKQEQGTMAVAVVGTTVPDALSALKAELEGLKVITGTQYKTGSDGRITGFSSTIQEETLIENLVRMHSACVGKANAYDKSLERLSSLVGAPISAPVWKDNGASLESIEADIALRIQILSVSERKAELEALMKEAEGFLTKEDQFKMFQMKMAAALGQR